MDRLARFQEAQDPVWETVLAELRAGRKESHWMWFVFPQIAGLGESAMSRRYAIQSLEEAEAYLAHPVLGARLRDGVEAVLGTDALSAIEVFGPVDAAKFRSCLTLFAAVEAEPFGRALARFYGGERDPLTVKRL